MIEINGMLEKKSLGFIGFLQATGIIVYCGLVGMILWQGDTLFGPMPSLWGPPLLLVLFSTSVLVCALLTFGYAFKLLYVKKEPQKAIKLVAYTALWLMMFVFVALTLLAAQR